MVITTCIEQIAADFIVYIKYGPELSNLHLLYFIVEVHFYFYFLYENKLRYIGGFGGKTYNHSGKSYNSMAMHCKNFTHRKFMFWLKNN